jgi:hypothetical protein
MSIAASSILRRAVDLLQDQTSVRWPMHELMDMFSNDASEQMRVAMDYSCLRDTFNGGAAANKGATAGVLSSAYDLGTDNVPVTLTVINTILAYVDAAGGSSHDLGVPHFFLEASPGSIAIYPVPDVSANSMLSARVSTKPKRTATQLNDVLFDDWVDVIVAGAQSRILVIPGQFFTGNPARAELAFRRGISQARGQALRGSVEASLTVQPRPFA